MVGSYLDICFHTCLYVCIIISGFGVIFGRNIVQAVYFTILTKVISSIIFFYVGADFIAIVYIIVYVGAIAILFLFVIMMLNVRVTEITESLVLYIPLGFFFFLLLLIEVYLLVVNNLSMVSQDFYLLDSVFLVLRGTNLQLLGLSLYSTWRIGVIISGFILLVALIGSIVLTVHHEKSVLRQEIFKQVEQTYATSIKLQK